MLLYINTHVLHSYLFEAFVRRMRRCQHVKLKEFVFEGMGIVEYVLRVPFTTNYQSTVLNVLLLFGGLPDVLVALGRDFKIQLFL